MKKCKLASVFLSSPCIILPVPFHNMERIKYGDETERETSWVIFFVCVFCSVKEIKPHTIEFKKRWHIYCNINVIYIVISCWKRQKIQIPVAAVCFCFVFVFFGSTIPFHLTQEQIFYYSTMEIRWEFALLGIWSSYEAFVSTKLRATLQLCSWDAICKFPVIMDRLL